MKTFNIVVIMNLITATLLGVYGQDLAYLVHESSFEFNLIKSLTLFTVLSLSLYIINVVSSYIMRKKNKITEDNFYLLLYANLGIGFFTSMFSLFVLAMWWG